MGVSKGNSGLARQWNGHLTGVYSHPTSTASVSEGFTVKLGFGHSEETRVSGSRFGRIGAIGGTYFSLAFRSASSRSSCFFFASCAWRLLEPHLINKDGWRKESKRRSKQ
jgi:hypothetical protein